MEKTLFRHALALIALLSYLFATAQTRPFTVKDDIEMERFNEPLPSSGEGSPNLARLSPDGKVLAIVTTRGIIATNKVRSTISLCDVHAAKHYLTASQDDHPPKRKVIAQLDSLPHHSEANAYAPVIKDMRWSTDSTHLYFRGEDSRGVHHLYSVKTDGTDMQVLSPGTRDVWRYEVGDNVIVYKATEVPDTKATFSPATGSAEAIDGRSIPEILFPVENGSFLAKTWKLWTVRLSGKGQTTVAVDHYRVRAPESMSASSLWDPIAISPVGDQVVMLKPVDSVPSSWSGYDPSIGHDSMQYRSDDPALVADDNQMRPRVYTLINLQTGRETSLLDAPEGLTLGYLDHNQIVWSSDGRRVLLANTFMPLRTGSEKKATTSRPCVIASVDLPSLKSSCLIFNSQGSKNFTGDIFTGGIHAAFGSNDDHIVIAYGDGQQGDLRRCFHYEHNEWTESHSKTEARATPLARGHASDVQKNGGPLRFEVKQGLNDSPKLWVTDADSGASKVLWDPNPQLGHLEFGEASVFKWKDRTGREWTGGLVKPVGYVQGKKYPLVIQLYEFDPHTFLTDGSWPTAFAARHLASVGFVVLQIEKDMVMRGGNEAQEHLEAYLSAINALAADDLIDRSRVGLVGFSTTAWYVENALIQCPTLFGAATIADGLDHSYMQYHLSDERSAALQQMDEDIIGARPVGDGLKRWLQAALGFNLDKIRTPLRIEAIRPFSLLGEWEIYSSLKMQGKPVDLIYFPNSRHIHQGPQARLESQQGNVDWMRFWLQGYEDSDPQKANQYRRWERLRSWQKRAPQELP